MFYYSAIKERLATLAAREYTLIKLGTVLPGRLSTGQLAEFVASAEAIGYTPDEVYNLAAAGQLPVWLAALLKK